MNANLTLWSKGASFVLVLFKFKNFKAQSLEIFKWVDLNSTAKTKRKSQTYAFQNDKKPNSHAFASGAEKFLHLLAQEFKHENHKRDKAQTQNAKVELVPLPCKKAH